MKGRLFGDPQSFAIGHELRTDPDGCDATWGALRLFAGGRLITRGLVDGEITDSIEISLGRVAAWLAEVWETIAHESRLPSDRAIVAAHWYAHALRSPPERPETLRRLVDERRRWWKSHSLGAAVPGFRIPDIHFRRVADEVEVSWDDAEWRTVPGGAIVLEPPDAIRLPAPVVLLPLLEWLEFLSSEVASRDARSAGLPARVAELRAGKSAETRALRAAGSAVEKAIERLVRDFGADRDVVVKRLLGLSASSAGAGPFLGELPAPVLLYRSASPRLSPSDVEALANLCEVAANAVGPTSTEWMDPDPCPLEPEECTASGVELALAFREKLGIPEDATLTGDRDLEAQIRELGISICDLALQDPKVDGVAVAGERHAPTIGVNKQGRFSRTQWGRRMSLAHELCHLAHDGGPTRRVGIVSNPWAPPELERRANAFAITLIAPAAAIEAELPGEPEDWTLAAVRRAMRSLGVGATALTWQLHNVGRITDADRRELLDALTEG